MPQIIPRQITQTPTNVSPGIGSAIGKGLQSVAGVFEQFGEQRFEEQEFEIKSKERVERNSAIEAYNEKGKMRHKAMLEIRNTVPPEDYLDALEEWESNYNNNLLSGKSQVFSDNFITFDRISQFNAMGRMSTSMGTDMLNNEKVAYSPAMDEAIKNSILSGDMDAIYAVDRVYRDNGILGKAYLQEKLRDAEKEVHLGRLYEMEPMDRIDYLDSLDDPPDGIDVAKEKRVALSEYNANQSISAIQNNSNKFLISNELSPVFNDGTATYADAVRKLDSLGYSKDSAPYIYGMGLIESAYDISDTGDTEDTVEDKLLLQDTDETISSANAMMQKYSSTGSGSSDEKEDMFRNLQYISNQLQLRSESILKSKTMSQEDKLLKISEIQATHEKIVAGMSGINGESVASQAIQSIKMIGTNREFLNPVEEQIWRTTLLESINKMPGSYDVIQDPDQRTKQYRKFEEQANLAVGLYREYTGTNNEIIDKVVETTVNPAVVSIEEKKANVYSNISSGRMPEPSNIDDARQLAAAILPKGVTQDVIDMEATRLMNMAPKEVVTPQTEQGLLNALGWMIGEGALGSSKTIEYANILDSSTRAEDIIEVLGEQVKRGDYEDSLQNVPRLEEILSKKIAEALFYGRGTEEERAASGLRSVGETPENPPEKFGSIYYLLKKLFYDPPPVSSRDEFTMDEGFTQVPQEKKEGLK